MEIDITASFVTCRLKGWGQRPAIEGQGGDHGQEDLRMHWEEPGPLAKVGGLPRDKEAGREVAPCYNTSVQRLSAAGDAVIREVWPQPETESDGSAATPGPQCERRSRPLLPSFFLFHAFSFFLCRLFLSFVVSLFCPFSSVFFLVLFFSLFLYVSSFFSLFFSPFPFPP